MQSIILDFDYNLLLFVEPTPTCLGQKAMLLLSVCIKMHFIILYVAMFYAFMRIKISCQSFILGTMSMRKQHLFVTVGVIVYLVV